MNPLLQKSLQHLTGAHQIEQVSEDTLHQLVQQYPFLGPARLLLAYKTKGASDHHITKQNNQLAALYFCNQHWLHYLLHEDANQEMKNEMPAFSFPSNNLSVPEDLPVGAPIHTASRFTEPPSDAPVETTSFETTVEVPTLEAYKAMMEGNTPPKTETFSSPDETKPIQSEPLVNSSSNESVPEEKEHNPFLEKVQSKQANSSETDSNNKIAAILQAQLEAFKQPVADDAPLVTAQAPHMVDYFESQGIKIDLTQIPQDKLTTKLRKFTDWLKQMKNHNPNPVDLGTDPALETAVSAIAQTSNEMREVVTETMADVLLKQGQVDKAIQLYIKLSFLNPEKSAYFAAKIQELKGIEK